MGAKVVKIQKGTLGSPGTPSTVTQSVPPVKVPRPGK